MKIIEHNGCLLWCLPMSIRGFGYIQTVACYGQKDAQMRAIRTGRLNECRDFNHHLFPSIINRKETKRSKIS